MFLNSTILDISFGYGCLYFMNFVVISLIVFATFLFHFKHSKLYFANYYFSFTNQ